MKIKLAAVILTLGMSPAIADDPMPHRTDLSLTDRERVWNITRLTDVFDQAQKFERMSAGKATSQASVNGNAFSHPSANLKGEERSDFFVGNGLFKKIWVSSPASTQASDGLGPLFNARSCQRCHLKDGRGHPPNGPNDTATSMFLRLSVPPQTPEQEQALAARDIALVPEPTYGGQLQDQAVQGLPGEGRMRIEYTEITVELSGGETASLRAPTYSISDLGYGPMAEDVLMSPRVAPQMIGLGLLEAIHPGDILSQADPDDADGDGISGSPSWVKDKASGELVLGRFGWKAGNPTILAQSASAFAGDIGISSPLAMRPYGDCTDNQAACFTVQTGLQDHLGDSEAPDPILGLVTFYSKNLAVPARRDVSDPEVLRGKEMFHATGCVACHTPSYVTSRDAESPEHRFQLIWPYTDMLLHDMGPGLAVNRPVGDASGSEWRTPPLWGIGLTETVNGHTFFLHDGRARSLLEAVLWHGGEAQAARDAVVAMDPADRAALIRFLESL